ncbi:MAG: hypothetical protein HQL88_00995, partial [Magnetococcales bacterium]|nr:hypothetical protein [Magnetococcales bacterium]
MKISTFQAKDMREVLKEVKEKLGADAVILSTRSIRLPGGGMTLGRTVIEVTACPGPNARDLSQESSNPPQTRPTPPAAAGRQAEVVPPVRPAAPTTSGRFSRVVDDPVDYPPVKTASSRAEVSKPLSQEPAASARLSTASESGATAAATSESRAATSESRTADGSDDREESTEMYGPRG